MSLNAVKPPLWVWPARVAGLLLLLLGLALPGGYVWRRSMQAMPTERVVSQSAWRPAILILPTGTFAMGSDQSDPSEGPNEQPQHEVELTRRFGISETEVTQGQYEAVMGKNPAHFKDQDEWQQLPVEQVSWMDALEYCNKLSTLEGLPQCYQINGEQVKWERGQECLGYRLPTEAEWEYAARADEKTVYAGSNLAGDVAWYGEELELGSTHAVKTKMRSNQWGLYDMSGNVWEWVWDFYATYQSGSQKNPINPLLNDSERVIRGGAWSYVAQNARVAYRGRYSPGISDQSVGFRLSRSYP